MSEKHATGSTMPAFPYGAVYFRKSNPPRADWEQDYRTAAEDGINVFRHWFMWSAVETKPGTFDWSDYDTHFDLAGQYGFKVVIGEISHSAPEWAFRRLAHCRYQRDDGSYVESRMRNSSATGGFPGLCLDHEEALAAVERFLTELVNRYKDHPALGAYDIWNETNTLSSGYTACYCDATAQRFREWLQEKYGDVKSVSEAWRRYGYEQWEDVVPPKQGGPYPDELDWIQFRADNAQRLLQWRVALVRRLDPHHLVTAHGVAAAPLYRIGTASDDFWRSASAVDSYGFTWGGARYGNAAWQQYHVVDMVRSGSGGKPFWHSEATAGPSWLGGGQDGRPRDDGRIPTAADVRLWNLSSFAGGATGLMYNRWRPLLDGPLFGALAGYDMDGSRTERSEMMSRITRWANTPERAPLWRSRPVRGDIGIVYVPEAAMFASLSESDRDAYANAARGAYQAFFSRNIQADWVHIKDIGDYRLLYLPYPVMLPRSAAGALANWVRDGGRLVSEGCPAYFDGGGRAGTRQPNLGLDEVFGALQEHVEFTPDLLPNERVDIGTGPIAGSAAYLQVYSERGGTASGWDSEGRIVAVDHAYGDGTTRLIGTSVGIAYNLHPDKETGQFFESILRWANVAPLVRTSDARLTARLHEGESGTFLWVTNPTHDDITATVTLRPERASIRDIRLHWGSDPDQVNETALTITVGAKDAAVMEVIS
jgi:beta-galactosidase